MDCLTAKFKIRNRVIIVVDNGIDILYFSNLWHKKKKGQIGLATSCNAGRFDKRPGILLIILRKTDMDRSGPNTTNNAIRFRSKKRILVVILTKIKIDESEPDAASAAKKIGGRQGIPVITVNINRLSKEIASAG